MLIGQISAAVFAALALYPEATVMQYAEPEREYVPVEHSVHPEMEFAPDSEYVPALQGRSSVPS